MGGTSIINFLFVAMYMAFGLRLIRPNPQSWDVLKIRLNLLPYYFKFVAVIMILAVALLYIFVIKESEIPRAEEMLLFHLSFSLLLLVFSKDKSEDELIEHIRLRAILASIIAIIIAFGMSYPMLFFMDEVFNEWIFNFGSIMSLFSLFYLIYFNYTKFRMRK